MKITNFFVEDDCISKEDAMSLNKNSDISPITSDIVKEHLVSVFFNETLSMELVCTPSSIIELVLGRLFTEGLIESLSEIEHIYLCDKGIRCRIFFTDHKKKFEPSVESVPSCCTGNRIFVRPPERTNNKKIHFLWKKEWIFAIENYFSKGSPIHTLTHGTHSCILAKETSPLYLYEDLGRHNALDKVIGAALLSETDLSDKFLFTSGRIPVDMMQKVIRSGIPLIASNAAPTDQAIHLAREYGITLICKDASGFLTIYNGSEYMI